ncbi:MAG: NAD(P)/FAD-dependent oxidoreductase [Chloroflexi bacterium]|nr:NAD(P)/FAD-dependent oxidoreductase [Chloroflexota bacterium]
MRIAVIGGGAAGLAAADELLRLGHQVLLFERAPVVGGQLRTVAIADTRLECFYHHLFTSDTLMAQLIQELGLSQKLRWVASRVGFFTDGRIWDFVTPLDLLRFRPLPLVDRLRLGLVSLYLQRQSDWRRYEDGTAQEWLKRWAGENAYQVVWGPLLTGKFGSAAPEIGMTWFHWKMRLRFGSRRGMGREHLGYLEGSFAQVWEALAQRVAAAGGRIYTQAQVEGIQAEEGRVTGISLRLPEGPLGRQAVEEGLAQPAAGDLLFPADRVIATIPSTVFLRLAPELPEQYVRLLTGTRYQAVMCLILVLRHPLSHIYWLNISDRSIPFVAVIEQTNLMGPQHYGGKHVVYLSNYIARDASLYQMADQEVLEAYLPHLARINPAFRRDWIEEWHLFREDAAQPIITTGYSRRIPSLETPVKGLYLANNTQVYPEDRGQNYSLRIGRQVARLAVGHGDEA